MLTQTFVATHRLETSQANIGLASFEEVTRILVQIAVIQQLIDITGYTERQPKRPGQICCVGFRGGVDVVGGSSYPCAEPLDSTVAGLSVVFVDSYLHIDQYSHDCRSSRSIRLTMTFWLYLIL